MIENERLMTADDLRLPVECGSCGRPAGHGWRWNCRPTRKKNRP